MRWGPAPLALALLTLGLTACGTTAHSTGKTAGTGRQTPGLFYDRDDGPVRFFGHEAEAAETQAIGSLVRRYYALAARADGTGACPLIHSLISTTIVEDYGHVATLRGKSCATVISKLFAQHRRELVADSATLEVLGVRVEANRALVLLRFQDAREPDHIEVSREGRTWRIWELLAGRMP